jgi:DUF4097 and DUF4098 domain-containing protein YvlB
MRVIRSLALVVLVCASADPAAAQDPDWLKELEGRVARQAEAIARAVEAQLARLEQRGQERAGQRGARGPEVTEPFSRTARLGDNGTLDLQNVAGDIVVTGTGGRDVRIEAVKRVRGRSDAEARTLLRDLQVQVAERGGSVEVRTTYPRGRGGSAQVDYTVSVPEDANVTLRTVSGEVRVSNVRGELRAQSVSGDITAASVRRVRDLRSVSGTLEVSDGEGSDIDGATVSGDVVVRNLKVRTLELTSVSGNMRFSDVESERANLTSVSGNIDYAGRLARGGRYELSSHSGNVRVVPGTDAGFDLDATTFSGNVRTDYPVTPRSIQPLGFNNRGARGLRGTFGSSGAALVLQSFSGNITILKQ